MWGMGGSSCKDIQVTVAASKVQHSCVGSGQPRLCTALRLRAVASKPPRRSRLERANSLHSPKSVCMGRGLPLSLCVKGDRLLFL